MERSIVAVEENQQRDNSINGASSFLGPLVKIDSISIDLGITMEKKNEAGDKCHHFTIRGYVEEMRKKDSELCDPFSSFREDSSAKDQAPPMATTKCRWWGCHKCPHEMGKASGDAAVNNEKIRTDLNIADNLIGPEVQDLLIKGHDSVLDDIANNQEVSQIQILNQGLVNEGHAYFAVPHQSKISKPVEVSDATGTRLAIEYHKISSSDEEQRNLLINNQKMPKESGKHTEEAKVDKGKSVMIPSLIEKDLKTASPECEEVDNEDSGGIQKRKPQKVRLLTELLGSKEKEENNRAACGTYSNTALLEALEPPSTSPNMLLQDGNSFLGTERKRKAEEENQTIDGSLLKNVGKRARTLKGDEDLMKNLIEISDSDTEDVASHGGRSKSKMHGGVTVSNSLKNRGMEYKNYIPLQHSMKESSSSSKKKSKTPQIEESQTFLMPPRLSQNGSQKLNYEASSRMGLDLSLSDFLLPRPKEISAHHNLDLSGPSNSKKPTEAHESQRNSEEPPMEIVELMAKKQYERALCEAEKNNRRNNHKRSNSDMMTGFPNRVEHGNGVMRSFPKEYPSMRKPPPTPGMLPPGENVNLFLTSQRSRYSAAPQEENPGMKKFDAFSPNIQFQHSFQNDKPEKLWSFRPPLIPEGGATNRNPEKKKEKIVRGFDLNHLALNTSNFDCPNTTPASEPWMSTTYHTPSREQRGLSDQNPKPISSSFESLNSQDAISAMHLLSLMDAGMNRNTSYNVDPKRVLEKPFYPCRNHPSLAMEKQPLTQCTYNAKSAFQGVGSGVVYKAGESSRQSSWNKHGKNQNPDTACFCAADPIVSPLFQTPTRPVGTDNLFFKSQEKENERRVNLKAERKPRKYVKHGSGLPPSLTDLGKRESLDKSYKRTIVSPVMLTSRTEYCSLNRNPADFTIPGNHNQFMISGEQLGFSKK